MEETGIIELINKQITREYEISRKRYLEDFFDKNPDASEQEAYYRFLDEVEDFMLQINKYKNKDGSDRPFEDIFDFFPPEELDKDYE